MKVTVCFRDIKVVVPCGNGSGLVKDLLEEAITRYRKAQAKNSDSALLSLDTVKLLLCDGGILDLDDKIVDVIDDKEQIQAIVDDNNNRLLQELNDNNGDGMSGSSLGTCSPDIFNDNLSERRCNGKDASDILADDRHDIIITERDFLAESGLRVRRGSEPTLCTSSDLESLGVEVSAEFPIYSSVKKNVQNAGNRKEPLGSNFKIGYSSNAVPLGSVQQRPVGLPSKISPDQEKEQDKEIIVVLPKSREALGIHVVPEFDQAGRNIGLLIEKIERGGRADRDGRLQKGDKITEINFQNLFQVDFPKAQEIFRSAFLAPELQIKLLRPAESAAGNMTEPKVQDSVEKRHLEASKKVPPAVPARSPKTQLSLKATTRLTMQTIPIELNKGADGLGFSVTTHGNRDNGYCPIYIKNIFSTGAAIEDGRLKPGDVLLEINGVPLVSKTKAEAVRLLRNLPRGSSVRLLVSRAVAPPEESILQQLSDLDNRPVMRRPLSTTEFHPTSTSSCSDRTEEEDMEEDKGPENLGLKESVTSSRKFGSMSNIAKSGLDNDFDEEDSSFAPDPQTGVHPVDTLRTASTLQKSRKSISMDDLRRKFAQPGVEVSFDDDVDFPATPFHKMRDFNQSFRVAVIDKSYNKSVATGSGAQSAEYMAAIEKIEKLKRNTDKKNKNKKEQERGSGRKFGWLFRFGKGRKSDSDRNRSDPPEAPGGKDGANKTEKPPEKPPVSDQPTSNSGLPVAGYKSVQSYQPSSHISGHSRYPSEPVRDTESSSISLHKEDYMITSVPSQQPTSHNDRSRDYTKHTVADPIANDPQSYMHQRELGGHWFNQPRHHENVNDRYDVMRRQARHPPPSNIHRDSQLSDASNVYLNWGYSKPADLNQRFYQKDMPVPASDYQPPLKYHDNNLALRSYKMDYYQDHRSQFVRPNTEGLSPQRDLQPPARAGHYYSRDNFAVLDHPTQYRVPGTQSQDFQPQQNHYTQDPTWGQYPLDLSRYAVRAQDRADVGYGFRGREYDLHARQQSADLKIPHQASSAYPPYKNVSPGIATNADFAREQTRQLHKKSAALVEQLQRSDHYQAQLRQNNPTFIAERW